MHAFFFQSLKIKVPLYSEGFYLLTSKWANNRGDDQIIVEIDRGSQATRTQREITSKSAPLLLKFLVEYA